MRAEQLLLFPETLLHGRGRLGNMTRERNDQRDRVFGGRDVVAFGRVHDDDTAFGGGGDIDIVDADAGATHDAKVLGGREDLGGHLRVRANDEAVRVLDQLEEFVGRAVGLVHDFDSGGLLEDGDSFFREGIGNDDFRHLCSLLAPTARRRAGGLSWSTCAQGSADRCSRLPWACVTRTSSSVPDFRARVACAAGPRDEQSQRMTTYDYIYLWLDR